MEIQESELYNITGGAVKYAVWAIIGGLIAMAVGIVDGFLRPLSCNK